MKKIRLLLGICTTLGHFLTFAAVNGVVIEGLDFTGKTSTCKGVEARLSDLDFKVRYQHGQVSEFELAKNLVREAFVVLESDQAALPDFKKTFKRFHSLRLAQFYVDIVHSPPHLSALKDDGFLLLQDRSFFSHFFLAAYLYPEEDQESINHIKTNFPSFKHKIFLTCTKEERMQRAQKSLTGDKISIMDNIALRFPDFMEGLNEFAKQKCLEMGWVVIDTTSVEINDVVEQIVNLILHSDRDHI